MKKVIVTGANGFIGSSFIKLLIDKGIRVVAIDLSFTTNKLPQSKDLLTIETGLNDVELLCSIIPVDEYDAFYHFAWRGVNGIDKTNPIIQLNNIQMTINCATIANNIGCKKFLCAGTITEQSINSISQIEKTSGGMMYGVAKHCTHLMLEAYCKNIGLNFVWMQFSNIYGVGNNTGNLINYTITELLRGKNANFGPAEQPYDFIYIDDLLEAVFRLGFKETKLTSYFIGSGSPQILKMYLLKIGELCDLKEKIKFGEIEDDGIKYDFEMFNNNLLIYEIGTYVTTSFDAGILKTLNWLKSQIQLGDT